MSSSVVVRRLSLLIAGSVQGLQRGKRGMVRSADVRRLSLHVLSKDFREVREAC